MLRALLLLLALSASGACHRSTYTTNLPRGETKEVWNHFFVLGLFGYAEIDARKMCPGGIAQVTAYQHITHILLTTITVGIYSPRSVYVTCAADSPPPGARSSAVAPASRKERSP